MNKNIRFGFGMLWLTITLMYCTAMMITKTPFDFTHIGPILPFAIGGIILTRG